MIENLTRRRLPILLAWAALTLTAVGCGTPAPEAAPMTEAERKAKVKQDADQIMQERKRPPKAAR